MAGEINMKSSKPKANALSGSEWLRHSFSIWRNLGRTKEEKRIKHPAMFTVNLVSRLLDSYTSCNGEIVLDPFAGSGTTLIAATEKNMSAIGLDINEEFRDAYISRIASSSGMTQGAYHVCDIRDMATVVPKESVDICITSPPYWNILNRKRTADKAKPNPYSAMKHDLGNINNYDEFRTALASAVTEIFNALKPGGFFILNVMDLRQKSKFYPLHMDASIDVSQCGFSLEDIIIWDRQDEYNNMRPLGYPYKFIINKVHEYLLVFRK